MLPVPRRISIWFDFMRLNAMPRDRVPRRYRLGADGSHKGAEIVYF